MTGGDLKIEVLPAGAAGARLRPARCGLHGGGHGVLVYHYGKTALALWGRDRALRWTRRPPLAWHKYGGGKELLAKLYDF